MKKLCEFSTVWAELADWADLGSTETALQTAQWSKVLIHGRNIYFGYDWEK